MPRLYCEEHGREHEAETIGREPEHRREGETVLIVRGALKSGPWRCDRCNVPLDRGVPAYLASLLPAWITGQTPEYDFAYEREYFAITDAVVAVYGAPCRGIKLGAGGRAVPFRGGRHRPREPLCALDLFSDPDEPAE